MLKEVVWGSEFRSRLLAETKRARVKTNYLFWLCEKFCYSLGNEDAYFTWIDLFILIPLLSQKGQHVFSAGPQDKNPFDRYV